MTKGTRLADGAPSARGRRVRFRLPLLLGLVAACAVAFAAAATYRGSRTPWERTGGMIGWNQAALEARLGPPDQLIEGDAPDEHARRLRPRSPGTYRTLVYRTFDGRFVAWLRRGEGGRYQCFQSAWVEKRRYY